MQSAGRQRRPGFFAATARHDPDNIRQTPLGKPPISMATGADALNALLDRSPDTDAVVGVSDLVAFGALAECQRRRIEVPGPLALAGFGNYEIGAVWTPRLTSVDAHAERIGGEAARRRGGEASRRAAERRPNLPAPAHRDPAGTDHPRTSGKVR